VIKQEHIFFQPNNTAVQIKKITNKISQLAT